MEKSPIFIVIINIRTIVIKARLSIEHCRHFFDPSRSPWCAGLIAKYAVLWWIAPRAHAPSRLLQKKNNFFKTRYTKLCLCVTDGKFQRSFVLSLRNCFTQLFSIISWETVPARSFPQDRSCVLLRRNSKRAQIRESQLTFDRQETKIAPKKLPLNKYDPNIWHLRLRLCSPNWNQLEVVSSKANRKV